MKHLYFVKKFDNIEILSGCDYVSAHRSGKQSSYYTTTAMDCSREGNGMLIYIDNSELLCALTLRGVVESVDIDQCSAKVRELLYKIM